jgi:hypothetical protein
VAKLHGLSLTIDSSYPGSCVTLERDQPAAIPAGSGGPVVSGGADRLEPAEQAERTAGVMSVRAERGGQLDSAAGVPSDPAGKADRKAAVG